MKNVYIMGMCLGLFLCAASVAKAQATPQKEALLQAEEEEGPQVFKFEPRLMEAEEERRRELLFKKALIDSMDLSESKRLKLIRDLYRNKESKRLKAMLAETNFEEEQE